MPSVPMTPDAEPAVEAIRVLIIDDDIDVIADNGKRKRADDEAPGADDDSAKEARID